MRGKNQTRISLNFSTFTILPLGQILSQESKNPAGDRVEII